MCSDSKYRRVAESVQRALDEAEEQHALISIMKKCINSQILHDDNPLRFIEAIDKGASPSGNTHNSVVSSMLDQSVLNAYTRSIIESDFEMKTRWTDVFRKLEDGPGCAKKTMKYHFALKDRARVKEYYRQMLYVVCKTWIHAAICRAVAPYVPELKEYRTFTYSGNGVVTAPQDVLSTMHKTSEPGAPFETWCKADITGAARYRGNKDRLESLRRNKSFYVVRYVGVSHPYSVPPDRELMIRMAATFPGYSRNGNEHLATCIVDGILGKIPRTQWLSLFNDCEFYWGHGKIMSFPVCLGRVVPVDPTEVFDPQPIVDPPPHVERVPDCYVYDRPTALLLVSSVDLLREILEMCCIPSISGTPEERRWVGRLLFTPEIICDKTEAEAKRVMEALMNVPLSETKKLKRLLDKYTREASSDVTQWRFFVRLVQACKLPVSASLDNLYVA